MRLTSKIRKMLREAPDGLPEFMITEQGGFYADAVRRGLRTMPDAYIDRWVKNYATGRWARVWVAVVPPPHCPPPKMDKRRVRNRGKKDVAPQT